MESLQNGLQPVVGCNPLSSNSIVFNENSIASTIAELSLTLYVNGPLDIGKKW